MTPEEFIAEAKRRGKSKEETQAKFEQLQASGAFDAPQAPEEPEMSGLDTARGAIEAVNRGTTLGFGDEIVGAGRAVAESMMGGSEFDFGDDVVDPNRVSNYEMYRDDQRDVAERFRKANPKTALGLELAGGLASPVNFVGPGLNTAKGVGAFRHAATVGARGAAEGAATGLGEAEGMDDAWRRMKNGAFFGGATAGTLGLLGRGMTRRRIGQDLVDEAGDQLPIHMIDPQNKTEKAMMRGYRDFLGRVPFTHGKLLDQQQPFIQKAEDAAEAAGKLLDAQKRGVNKATRIANRQAAEAADKSIEAAESALSSAQLKMRQGQAVEGVPSYNKKLKEVLADEADPQEAFKKLDDFWTKEGFQSVKGKDFKVDDNLAGLLEREGFGAADGLKGLRLKGETLMDMRNAPAMQANASTKGQIIYKSRKEVDKFDDEIERLLKEQYGGDGLDMFKQDRGAYGDFAAYRDATYLADKADGQFTGEQLASTGWKKLRARKEGKGQKLGKQVRDMEKEVAALRKAAAKRLSKFKTDPARADAKSVKLDEIKYERSKVNSDLADYKKRGVDEGVTLPSQLATVGALGLTSWAGGPLGIPLAAGTAYGLSSKAGQRAVAGQAAAQKFMQEDEYARLLAQLLRQQTSRKVAGAE